MSRTDVMSDPIGDPPRRKPATHPPSALPLSASAEDAFNPLDGSIEPTDDSPTVISKTPQPSSKTDDNFSGSLRGRRLAHFELLEPIGVGGMAAVLRARDTQLDRVVALKILPPEMASDAENIHRFHQEARSAAKLDHENIARVFFCGEDQRLHFIAFEFVEGDNLRTILERRGRLPVGEALHYMVQVAAGLAHASQRGVVHRDIKPSNIIVTPNGRAKLVDMGLARSLEPQHDMGLTHSGVTLGTFDYISPEQALEPREADVRSDIYSLGCTFYHMLTGNPPVPEGTAAKKLHHHQHVKPIDPRQFVPDLPDEVAVILDRMMAKQAKDRYQTPEQLVHHLYLTARKLGGGDEVPEGVLGVETAMPDAPANRSLGLAVLAAVAVIGLIFFLDRTSPSNPEQTALLPVDSKADARTQEKPASPVQPLPREDGSASTVKTTPVKQTIPTFNLDQPTAANLAEFLRNNKSAEEIVIELADDLDLNDRDDREPDLVVANPIVTIRPRDPKKRPTIRHIYRARVSKAIQVALTIESKKCTVQGLRFVLDQTGANWPMAGLLFRGPSAAQYQVHDCEFLQGNPLGKDTRMTSVLVESRGRGKLDVSESCFLGFASLGTTAGETPAMRFSGAATGGQDAITRRGPVRIEASNCVFGPHAATFRLEGAAGDEDGSLRLNHCSVLTANQSAVFDLTEGADARIVAEFSLFSHPGDPGLAGMADGKGAVLLRRASSLGQLDYKGRDNRYHQLDSYLVVADVSEDDQLDRTKKDVDSRELASSPWNDPQPLAQLEKLSIQAAFAVNPLLAELRVQKEANGQLIGVEKMLDFSYLANLPILKIESPAQPGRRKLVVDNSVKADAEKLLYPSLRQALPEARAGDTILLRLNGETPLDPSSLSGDNLVDLTIRADKGYRPILTLSGGTEEVDAALFRVGNGKLRLEDVEIRLQPSRDAYDSQAVVSFLGDGECTLKNCLITLDRSARKTALAVAVLAEPGKLMKKVEETRGPRFVLDNCFVRGQGDLVWSRAGQPADVTVKNSLVALTGSLLNVEGVKDMPAPAGSLAVQLGKSTTYLGGNLIRLRAVKDLKSLAAIKCKSDGCLFLPVSGERALIHLEAPESEHGLKDKINWESEDISTNAYGSFNTLLEQQATGQMMKMPQPSTLADWKTFSRETNSLYSAKLLNPPAADIAFAQLLPSSFRPGESWKDYGVEVAALRPLLPREKPELRTPKSELPDTDFN